MPLSPGARVGSYDIVAPLGAGGMGEVYRASDTRLKRHVAIKVLPAALAADPERLARFQREAEVLASLNHPNIAAVYGLEDADGVKALVMELVEGATLADRIAQGPVPFDEAAPIAKKIAEGLQAAHEQGIIHRDLKPANIKVRDDGTVKVLDFGLAKLADTGGVVRAASSDPSLPPTLAGPTAMTGIGMILGTAAYMSPEQARGRPVDKRTDVWAFGAVLYEMLTGTRAFEGDDVTEVMASVVKSTPNWAALPPETPPYAVALIQRCLEKDRNARIGDMAVARFLLDGHMMPAGGISAAPVAAPIVPEAAPSRGPVLPWLAAALLAAVAAAASFGWFRAARSGAAPAVIRLEMGVQPADMLVGSISSPRPARTAIAISPDGRTVVFSGLRETTSQLYARQLDREAASPIPGTENAVWPFFSPDGAWIGFMADGKLKKIAAAGGPASTICDVPGPSRGWGASWGTDGTIVFASNQGVATVSADGGNPTIVKTTGGQSGERALLPQWLPGGKAVLLTFIASNDWDTATVAVQPLDGSPRRVLITGGADARYVGTGHLVFMRSGTLSAVPFDVRAMTIAGAAVPLVENVMQGVNAPNGGDESGAGQYAVSPSGTLVYAAGGIGPVRPVTMAWVDRSGHAEPLAAVQPGPFLNPRLSPDGTRIAVNVRHAANRDTDVWVYDVQRGAPTRLTFNGGGQPLWSPDGKRIVYGGGRLWQLDADGGGKPEAVTTSDANQIPSSWSSANTIAFMQRPTSGTSGIWALAMTDRTPKLFLESRFSLWYPEFSPDGRLMAYASNESSASEIYVQPYPGPGAKIRISTSGGSEPLWAPNGRELLYRSFSAGRQQVFTVAIRSTSPLQADAPRLLFDVAPPQFDGTLPTRSWDVSPDGKRFLMLKLMPAPDKAVTTMHVVLNWSEELKRLVPAK